MSLLRLMQWASQSDDPVRELAGNIAEGTTLSTEYVEEKKVRPVLKAIDEVAGPDESIEGETVELENWR